MIQMSTKEEQLMKILEEIRKENKEAVKRNAKLNYELLKASEELASKVIEEEIEACREATNRLTSLRRQLEAEIMAVWNDIEDAITIIQVEAEESDKDHNNLLDAELIS